MNIHINAVFSPVLWLALSNSTANSKRLISYSLTQKSIAIGKRNATSKRAMQRRKKRWGLWLVWWVLFVFCCFVVCLGFLRFFKQAKPKCNCCSLHGFLLINCCWCCWHLASVIEMSLSSSQLCWCFLLRRDMVYKSSISLKEKHLLGVWSNLLAELSSRLTAAGQLCPILCASWRPKWIKMYCFSVDS